MVAYSSPFCQGSHCETALPPTAVETGRRAESLAIAQGMNDLAAQIRVRVGIYERARRSTESGPTDHPDDP